MTDVAPHRFACLWETNSSSARASASLNEEQSPRRCGTGTVPRDQGSSLCSVARTMKRKRSISNAHSPDAAEQTSPFAACAADMVQHISSFLPAPALASLALTCKWFAYQLMDTEQSRLYVPVSWRGVLWSRTTAALKGDKCLADTILRHFLVHDSKVHLLNGLEGAHRHIPVGVTFSCDILSINLGNGCVFLYKRYNSNQVPWPRLAIAARDVLVPARPFRSLGYFGNSVVHFLEGPASEKIQVLQANVRALHQEALEESRISRAVPDTLRFEASRLKRELSTLQDVLNKSARVLKRYSSARVDLFDFVKAAEKFASTGQRHLEVEKQLDFTTYQIDKAKEEIAKKLKSEC
jgi:hypothetical protein